MKRPDLQAVRDVVSAEIWDALVKSSTQLGSLGIPHALVGDLAASAYGAPCAMRDIEFLVGEQAFEFSGPAQRLVSLAPGVPIAVLGVPVHCVRLKSHELPAAALDEGPVVDGIDLAPDWAVAWLKLESLRMRDSADVVEMLKTGLDVGATRAKLPARLQGRFNLLVDQASEEDAA